MARRRSERAKVRGAAMPGLRAASKLLVVPRERVRASSRVREMGDCGSAEDAGGLRWSLRSDAASLAHSR